MNVRFVSCWDVERKKTWAGSCKVIGLKYSAFDFTGRWMTTLTKNLDEKGTDVEGGCQVFGHS